MKDEVFEHYFINFKVKGQERVQTTEWSFPVWRAHFLIDEANNHFSKAYHWLGDRDAGLEKVHPNYGGGEEWIDAPLDSWLD